MTQPNSDPHIKLIVGAPEVASTIERLTGATLETAREVAALLMHSATSPSAQPPARKAVEAEMDQLAADKIS